MYFLQHFYGAGKGIFVHSPAPHTVEKIAQAAQVRARLAKKRQDAMHDTDVVAKRGCCEGSASSDKKADSKEEPPKVVLKRRPAGQDKP